MTTPELRQMRYVVEVAQQRSFSRAAERLHVAQQALSQQIKSVENQLGVQLFTRNNRGVELTPAGVVFVQEARRVITAAERAVDRALAVAKGVAGSVRLVYTLATVYETLPAIAERVQVSFPKLGLELREVFGGEIPRLLSDGAHDVALCPRTAFPPAYARQEVRREAFVLAISSSSELAAGSTVWGNIAQGRGVGLVVRSLVDQLPRGITLVELSEPRAVLVIDLVWHRETAPPAVRQLATAAVQVAAERRWLPRVA